MRWQAPLTVLTLALSCWAGAEPAFAHGPTPPPARTPPLGTVRSWPDVTYDGDGIVMKDFALRGVGAHIEVWVGTDLPVASDECRSSNPANLLIADAQVRYLVSEFERTIRPVEAAVFGVPAPRDGRAAQPALLDPAIPADAFRGDGDHLVVLVDNFRSGGWTQTFIQSVTGRNVVAITAQGWPNTVGPRPANLGPDRCRTFTGYAVPHFHESLLAHEYNHLTKENRAGRARSARPPRGSPRASRSGRPWRPGTSMRLRTRSATSRSSASSGAKHRRSRPSGMTRSARRWAARRTH